VVLAARANKSFSAKKLVSASRQAAKRAYAPYSKYRVGAALLGRSEKISTGCNIENISYGATVCAERVALWKALSEGQKHFTWLAISSSGKTKPYPCGICRQVLQEFCPDLNLLIDHGGQTEIIALKDLFPKPFSN